MEGFLRLGKGGRAVASVVLILAGVLSLIPLVWTVALSVKPRAEVYTTIFLPRTVRLANFVDEWRFLGMGRLFLNSFVYVGGAALVTLFCATLAAYAFGKFRFRGSNTLFQILLLGVMVPSTAMLTGLMLEAKWLHLYNSRLGVILFYSAFSIPIAVVILRSFIETIPGEIIDAARVDGCSELRALVSIVLPLARPGLASVTIFTSMWNWNDFLRTLILLRDPSKLTVTTGLAANASMYVPQWELMAAGMLMAVAPIFVLYMAMKEQFVEGLTAGGVKL